MALAKSTNPLDTEMHSVYWIWVKKDTWKKGRLVSAKQLSQYVDEQFKIRLFNKLLDSPVSKHTAKVRNRLKIDFYLK